MVNNISCIIVDDEEHAIHVLEHFISETPMLRLEFSTTRPVEAFQYLQQHPVDLIFMDIEMPGLNGMELIKLIPTHCKVIFTTAFPDYALKSYEFNVADYLLKPILFDRFLKSVQKVMSTVAAPETNSESKVYKEKTDFVFIRSEHKGKLIKINVPEVVYIEALGNYISIQTRSERQLTLSTMKDLEQKLALFPYIIRVHKSFFVNNHYIKSIDGNRILLDKKEIPIGEKYKEHFLNSIRDKIV